MKALMRYKMSREEKRAFDAEIARPARQITDRFAFELDATILWALHTEFGFGAERLRRFYDCVAESREALLRHYEMQNDAEFILLHKLRDIGVDVRAWSDAQPRHTVIHVDQAGAQR